MAQVPRMKERRERRVATSEDRPNTRALTFSGLFIGGGMGGFFYAIVFHHIFQTSLMLSNRFFPNTWLNMQYNLYWDGMLLASVWIATAIGISMLWAVARRSDLPLLKNTFAGSVVMGWGFFNLIEGLVNHHFFAIHHIVQLETPANQLIYDYFYLGSGVLLVALGAWLRALDMNSTVVRRDVRLKTPQYTPV